MKEKKEKRRWGLMLFIVMIMVGTSFSVVFFGFSGTREVVKYNDIKFARMQDRWEAKINGKNAAFSFLPNEVEVIPDNESAKLLQNKFEIDVTYDQNSTFKEAMALAQHQMGLTLANYDIFVRKGFTSNNTFGLPIIGCKDATAQVPVVYFRHRNETKIFNKNSCVIVEASSNAEFIMAKDRLLYSILGVIK